jgi:2-polyprenyl-6-methoxyphenol hydroxylase-like FAD-dependent oxidoreductase
MARTDTARIDYDVIIAGGGVAGISAAVALKEFGWSVLIVEPGQHLTRRLGGELIHPSGVAVLGELGISSSDGLPGCASITGFVVFPPRGIHDVPIALPYAEGRGIALEHASIHAALLHSGRALPYVEMLDGRVVGIESEEPRVVVAVRQKSGERKLYCRMMIAADGASSVVRRYAGIPYTRKPVSTITGYLISGENLPVEKAGHVFIGSLAPLLVYEIGGGRARVLFDQPVSQAHMPSPLHRAQIAESIPHAALRAEVNDALAGQSGLSFVCADVLVSAAARGRVALVGDAGGSCHPLTATGMTAGITDALRLRQALREAHGDIPAALALYAQRRREPQRTRLLVASTLHQVCSGTSPELQLIRTGLIRYWIRGARERRTSMAILAMKDVRMLSALREMLLVVLHGLAAGLHRGSDSRFPAALQLGAGLAGVVIRQMAFAMRAR